MWRYAFAMAGIVPARPATPPKGTTTKFSLDNFLNSSPRTV
jgi:hypothetical protein